MVSHSKIAGFLLVFCMLSFVERAASQKKKPLGILFPEKLYDELFPHRDTFYSYGAFIKATKYFPLFAQSGNDTVNLRELFAFFANLAHETTNGWKGAKDGVYGSGLYYKEELSCIKKPCPVYNTAGNSEFKPVTGKDYHGRGPLQLSYAYNYGQAGKDLNLPLLENPELVTQDASLAFACAIWFWMKPQPPKPSCHDVMTGIWKPTPEDLKKGRIPGFGMTINIINGGLECNTDKEHYKNNREDRIGFFRLFCKKAGVYPGNHCDCDTMISYRYK